MVRKNLSILPRPWGRPTVEWMILMCRAIAVRSRWWLMKSEPWSTCKICRQPRPIRLPISSEDEDVEFGVVGLPGLVGVFGAAAEDELVLIPVGHRPFQSQGDKGRIESLDDFPHRRVARRRELTCLRVGGGKAVQGGDTRTRSSERQPFDERDRLGRGSANALVCARMRGRGDGC